MSNPLRILWWTFVAFLLGASVVQADELKELAGQAVELSGTRDTLQGLGKNLDLQMAADPRVMSLSAEQRKEFMAVLKKALDGNRMAAEITTSLAATGDRDRLRTAVAAMRDPVYLKVMHRVVAEDLNTTKGAVDAYVGGFQKNPPDKRRVNLVGRLDAATAGSRTLAQTRYETARKVLGPQLAAADREAKLAKLREQIDASAPNEYLTQNLYITRNIDVKDLERFVHAQENEAMQWLARQLGQGVQHSILSALDQMNDKLQQHGTQKH